VRVKLASGACVVTGRRAPQSLYQHALATYDRGDAFNHASALGFIELWGLPVKTQARTQLLAGGAAGPAGIPGIASAGAPAITAPTPDGAAMAAVTSGKDGPA
jgi:argininosuccinate synthase